MQKLLVQAYNPAELHESLFNFNKNATEGLITFKQNKEILNIY